MFIKGFTLRLGRIVRLQLNGHREAVNTVSVSPNGKTICTGSDDAQIIIWDAETGAFLASNNMHEFRVLQVIFANESRVISMSNNKLIMWDSPATSCKGSLDVIEFRR